jgi:hypothetical protein
VIVTQAKVNGKAVDVSGWTVKLGSFGSVDAATIETDVEKLKAAGVDLVALAEKPPTDPATGLPAFVTIEIWAAPAGSSTPIQRFGGDLDYDDWNFDKDNVKLSARGYAGRLMDAKVVLAADAYRNKTCSQTATIIAKKYGLGIGKIQLSIPGDPVMGFLYEHGDLTRPNLPRYDWDVLVFLAQQVGGVQVFVDFQKNLVFRQTPPVPAPRILTWKPPPGSKATPVRNLQIDHITRRNKTFQVRVMSYDPKTTKLTLGDAVNVDDDADAQILVDSGTTPSKGVFVGSAAGQVRVRLGKSLNGKPVYSFYYHGLDSQHASDLAESLALTIWSRSLIVSGEIDGDPTLTPQMQIQLVENHKGDLQGFAGKKLSLSSVEDRYELPQGGDGESGGYLTSFTALFLPPIPVPPPGYGTPIKAPTLELP